MNNKKILNISLLGTLLLFSACSNSQDKIKMHNVSIYNIMGITEGNHHFSKYQENISSDITYISYRKKNNYIEETYIEEEENEIKGELQVLQNIENTAKSFLGVPYVWGATGPNKFDCSGFTQWVYREAGINIPRVSKNQARVGQYVSYDNLQRGDMVFFDTKKRRTGRVCHVGIYLGNGNFIHASSAGKSVVIYNFDKKPFYKKSFLWGRRVIKPDFYYALN